MHTRVLREGRPVPVGKTLGQQLCASRQERHGGGRSWQHSLGRGCTNSIEAQFRFSSKPQDLDTPGPFSLISATGAVARPARRPSRHQSGLPKLLSLLAMVQCAAIDPYMRQCEDCSSSPNCTDNGVKALECTPGFNIEKGKCTTPSVRLACGVCRCDMRIVEADTG